MKTFSILILLSGSLALISCTPPGQSDQAAYTGPNRFGYQGPAAQASGLRGQPQAEPQGHIADALRGTPPSGIAGEQITQPLVPEAPIGTPTTGPQGPDPTVARDTTPSPTTAAERRPDPPASDLRGPDPLRAPEQPAADTRPAPAPQAEIPVGIPVAGKEGLVYSPHDREAGLVDVTGMPPGSVAECPYTLKRFLVP